MTIFNKFTKRILLLSLLITFVSCEFDKPIPSIPTGVTASSDFGLKVVLTWTASDDAENYDIYRADCATDDCDESGLTYAKIDTTEELTFEDLTVVSGSTYYYKIKATNTDNESEFSAFIKGKTISITADEAFTALGVYTGGARYDARYATEVPTIITNIIDEIAIANTDLVFLIDNTGSMGDDITEVKNSITSIISHLPSGTRLSIAVYNDANEDPSGWYDYFDLTTDYTAAQDYLNNISVYGGGDWPESVFDGIYNTVDSLSWSSGAKRMMLVIGDAPPLDGAYSTHTLTQVIDKCASMSVDVNLYPLLIGGSKSSKQQQ